MRSVVAARVIRISEPPQPVVNTEGETVDQPAQRATAGGATAAQSDQGSGLAVAAPSQALATTRGDERPAVQRALQAAIEVLEAARSGSERPRPLADARARVTPGPRPLAISRTQSFPFAERSLLSGIDAPESARAESFRLLRHRLRTVGDPRVVAVAAPRAGDEASICAAELALAYADSGPEHVLLVELDAEHPTLARSMGFTVEHCFVLQLCDKYDGSDEPWHAVSVFRANLHVLAINPSLSTGDRISLPAFVRAMSELGRVGYGHIVIACPRVLDSSDIALIQGVDDGVLLTGRVGHTTGRDLRRAAEQLAPAEILGTVLINPP
jgi:Mrp family chromosome partitioning ATPase